ncbi:MAG: PKD domain-containing protein [Bacteroidota bacterium]
MRLARLAFLLLNCCFVSAGYSYHIVTDSVVVCAGSVQSFPGPRSRAAGTILKWEWNFGDPASGSRNISTQESPQHVFSKAGSYRVQLVMSNNQDDHDTLVTPVQVFPTPRVKFTTSRVCVGGEVTFSSKLDSATWKDLIWKWEFGDGLAPSFGGPKTKHTFKKPGIYEVQLTVSPPSGCSTQVHQAVTARRVPEPENLVSDTVCFGDRAELKAPLIDSLNIHWFASAQSSASLHIGALFFTPPLPDRTTFFVAHKDKRGCLSSKVPVQVGVFSAESTHILTEPTTPLQWSETMVRCAIKGESALQRVVWSFGDGDSSLSLHPSHKYPGSGKYEIHAMAKNTDGCKVFIKHSLVILPPPPLFLPAAFSPNQDGINDTFKADSHSMESCSIQVTNTFGEIVFVDDTPSFAWDGKKLNGTLAPEDIYIYQIKGVDKKGKPFVKEGTITLVR